ncbi:MAG: methylmalonyl-CoA epimerase [Candidatus Neomarinimicrobiota bacterium]|tara:strand:+ start:1660 stop:2067 length:408 start_codon:yes stop_codon:yes gene_type:complete
MKILGIEHIGIAVKDLDVSAPFWKDVLKISHKGKETVAQEGVITDIYDTGRGKVELLKSMSSNSVIEKFLKNSGEGIHHVCFEVKNINKAILELKDLNINVLSEHPTTGVEGNKVVFIHPKSTGGVLVELAEKTS